MQKSTAEALGLLVMAGPVLIPVVWLVIAMLISWFVATFPKTRTKKIAAAIFTFVLLSLIPTWDEIAGQVYFHYLCKTKGGTKVFKKIAQSVGDSAETGQLEGKPLSSREVKKYLASRGLTAKIPAGTLLTLIGNDDNYYIARGPAYGFRLPLNIVKHTYSIYFVGVPTKPIGTWTTFGYGRGWFLNHITLQVPAVTCQKDDVGTPKDLLQQVFVSDQFTTRRK